jgi:hypothetical protein
LALTQPAYTLPTGLIRVQPYAWRNLGTRKLLLLAG